MAQKREKEETELKVPENLPLRTPTIPVSTPQPQLSGVAAASDDSRSNFARSPESSDPKLSGGTTVDGVQLRSISISASSFVRSDLDKKESKNDLQSRPLKRPRDANRCSGLGCRRKLGLMGFHCRCGDIFCSEHRYSDRHDCTFDYKAVGREAIARENPVVKAAKILKV